MYKEGDVIMRATESLDDRDDQVERILDNLRRIIHVLYGHSRRMERLAKLTSPQAWMITTLSRMEPTRISDLAHAMHLSPAAVVRIVGRLEERGLVARTRPSNDEEIVKVTLTHVGMKLAGRIPAIPQDLLLKGLSEIPPNRLRTISENLESLTRILGAGEATPRLFFAPVANLPAGARFRGGRGDDLGTPEDAVDEGLEDLGQAIDQTLDKLRKTGSRGH